MCDTTARLDGKVVVVTGGSSGIGLEAAKYVAKRGARVVIASHNETKLQNAQAEIINTTGNYNVTYKVFDLSSLKSVRNFANDVLGEEKLDVLINNAASYTLPDRITADDLNLTMQVNFFGAFLLTFLLLPKLKASAPSRIINVSSGLMYIGSIDFDHWNDVGRETQLGGVGSSKLALAVMTVELAERLKGTGVTANSYDPFIVQETEAFQNFLWYIRGFIAVFVNLLGQSRESSGMELGYLAAAPELQTVSGEYYEFCSKFFNHRLVRDSELRKRLWEEAKKLVKISPSEDWEIEN